MHVADHVPDAAGRRFGVEVTSGAAPLVGEGAVCSNAQGVFWAAGTNLLATKPR